MRQFVPFDQVLNALRGVGFSALLKCLVISVLLIQSQSICGQDKAGDRAERFKSRHQFVAPLDLEPLLSGNFGELRGNHFHTGIDLKTEGREGFPVLAATNGKVSRVKMSPWGYGNALYLEGPDGITTVYAHLQAFAPRVQSWAVGKTYAGRTLGVDASPASKDSLFFQAGDTLGWSGNTGGSGGPHLHFEIRDTQSQHPLNPLNGWVVKPDRRAPVIGQLWVEGERGFAGFSSDIDTVNVPNRFRLAVEAFDLLDGASNICGVRVLQATLTQASSVEVIASHGFVLDELDFAVNKDMNAHAFYPVWQAQRDQVHRLHRVVSNRLAIYSTPSTDGWVEGHDTLLLAVKVEDAAGNVQTARWVLRVRDGVEDGWPAKEKLANGAGTRALPQREGSLAATSLATPRVSWPKGTFFEETTVHWVPDEAPFSGTLYPMAEPYRKPVSLSWKVWQEGESVAGFWQTFPGHDIPDSQWVLIQTNESGEVNDVEVADKVGDAIVGSVRRGGNWTLSRDTVAPKVIPYHSGTPLVQNGDAVWFVDDDLSGVEEVELNIDGRWARCVWDPKRSMVTYESSDGIQPVGKACYVKLMAQDASGNQTIWERQMTWPSR